jgi:hypothetical protein
MTIWWLGTPWEGNYGGVKRIRRDEPNGVVIHICMEISQGNPLCSYLYLKLAKKSCRAGKGGCHTSKRGSGVGG